MRVRDALKLHNEDEVTVKRTDTVLRVVRAEPIPKEFTKNNKSCVDVLLEDGNWYEHREIK